MTSRKVRKPITKEKAKRRKRGSARGISGMENFLIQEQNNSNQKMKSILRTQKHKQLNI